MGAGIHLTITGQEKILKELKKMGPRVVKAIGGGLYLEGNNILTESKKLVPVDFGTLKASGYCTLPEENLNNVTVEIGFGGSAEDYAEEQHEHTEYNHPEGGQAKYLETPMYQAMADFKQKVGNFAKRLFYLNTGVTRKSDTPVKPT